MVIKFLIEPIENLGLVLHESILGDKIISDIFHFCYTLKEMSDLGFIEEIADISSKGGIWFLKMNETRYKHINGRWHTQERYLVSEERLDQLFNALETFKEWSPTERNLAKHYYYTYHGNIAEKFRKIAIHETSQPVLPEEI